MKLKRSISACVGAATVLLLLTQGGIAAGAEPTEPPPLLEIDETESGFVLADAAPLNTAQRRAQVPEQDGERTTLLRTSSGVPVVLNEQFSLPDGVDHDAAYAEAIAEAQVEKEPVLADVPEGEDDSIQEDFTSEEFPVDVDQLRPRAAHAVSPSSVTFHLNHSQSYDQTPYGFNSVYRGGELLDVFTDETFTVDGLAPESKYAFTVISSQIDPRTPEAAESESLATTRMFNIATPPASLEDAKSFDPTAAAVAAAKQPTAGQAYLHTTFIPYARASTNAFQNMGCGSLPTSTVEFSGDNRDYQTPGLSAPSGIGKYRSYVFISMNYMGPDSTLMTTDRRVGATTKYVNGASVGTKTAPATGIKINKVSVSRTYGQAVVDHSVTNPFCSIGAITYHDEIRFYRNSDTIELTGWRFPVPNHEISFRFQTFYAPGMYWLPAAWRGLLGFGCLTGVCPRDSYSQSMAGV